MVRSARAPGVKFGRGAAPCGSLRPARFRGSPAGLFAHLPHPFVCGFVASLPDAHAVPSNPESGCRAASGAAPLVSGHSPKKISAMVTNLVAFPLGFCWRAPLGLIVLRDGRAVRTVPADDSTSQERAARGNDGKPLPLAWRDDTLSYLAFCYQNQTRSPERTAPATSIIPGASHSSTCNFVAHPQR